MLMRLIRKSQPGDDFEELAIDIGEHEPVHEISARIWYGALFAYRLECLSDPYKPAGERSEGALLTYPLKCFSDFYKPAADRWEGA